MDIDHDALLAAIDLGRENSYGTDEASDLGKRRAHAVEAYLGLNTEPAPEGRSQVVDRSVFETIHTMLPSLVRIFASSSEDVAKAMAVGPDDEPAADQTTKVLNHVVTQLNPWEQICSDWIHDAMLLCNGYVLTYWDKESKTERETYVGQSDDQVAMLMQDSTLEVKSHKQYVDEQMTADALRAWESQAQQAQMAGQPAPPKPGPVILHDLDVEKTDDEGHLCIKVIPPEHCYVHVDTPDWTLNDCPYFEIRQQKTIAELRAMGLDVPLDISDDEAAPQHEDNARDRFGENRNFEDDQIGVMRKVWARMIWVDADAGEEEQEKYYCIVVGRTILFAEECERIHVISMTPQPLPHRHIGMSIAETVEDIQRIRTAVTRGGLDNLYLANNGRHAISSSVNLDDFLDARPGGVVRMLDDSKPAEGHIMPLTHPFAFDSIIGSLEYFDQVRQNRTGASRYFSGTDANAINKTAGGTIALQNMASMRVEHIARMMAPAVEHLFSIVQELLQKHKNKPLSIKINGTWTPVDPQAWRTKRDIRISVGVGAGNKESMLQNLGNLFGAQMQLAPMGLAGPAQIHSTVIEMAKLAGFSNPAKFWLDPGVTPPPPPQPPLEIQKVQMQLQADAQKHQAQAQQDQLKFQAEQQMERERLMLQAEVDKQREEMQARQKALEAEQTAMLERMRAELQAQADERKAEIEKYKANLDAAVRLEIASKSAQTTMDTAQLAKQPDSRVDQLIQTIEALRAEAESPAELVRDPNTGRAIAVKRGERVRKIARGPDGRAIGLQ